MKNLSVKKLAAALGVALSLHAASAWAVGTLIPATSRTDMVHDAARSVVYIANGAQVLRYHLPSGQFLSPINLGGQLNGIDLSPDGSTLAVADHSSSASDEWVHLVKLADLSVTKSTISKTFGEDGLWSVAYGADGSLFASAQFAGSGWVPLRRLLPGSTSWITLGNGYPDNTFRQNTMLASSGDGKVVAFAEANISDGPWGRFDLTSGQLKRLSGYTDGTSAFNFEIATNKDGSQYAIPTYFGTYVYNSAYSKVATIGQYAGPQPIGVAYHPVENLLYFPWAQTREVRVFDAVSFNQVGSYDFEDSFQTTGNWAFTQGRTRLSKDGSLLMVSVTGGVRVLQQYAPLSAGAVTGTSVNGAAVSLALKGSIGNNGALAYSLSSQPAHGTATVAGGAVNYTPAAGYVGSDTFTYTVNYGRASASNTVTINTTKTNRAPVAKADTASTIKNQSVAIKVLANDSDPDGDRLTISAVSVPTAGSAVTDGQQVIFTPARNFVGTASFNYTVSDGRGGSAKANVSVRVNRP